MIYASIRLNVFSVQIGTIKSILETSKGRSQIGFRKKNGQRLLTDTQHESFSFVHETIPEVYQSIQGSRVINYIINNLLINKLTSHHECGKYSTQIISILLHIPYYPVKGLVIITFFVAVFCKSTIGVVCDKIRKHKL